MAEPLWLHSKRRIGKLFSMGRGYLYLPPHSSTALQSPGGIVTPGMPLKKRKKAMMHKYHPVVQTKEVIEAPWRTDLSMHTFTIYPDYPRKRSTVHFISAFEINSQHRFPLCPDPLKTD